MSFARSLRHKLPKGTKLARQFGATPTDGFPSKLEKSVHAILLLRLAAKEIENLTRQSRVELTLAKIPCKIDFGFEERGKEKWAEAKGAETERWRIIKKLWRFYGPGELEIWVAGRGGEPYLQETIRPCA